MDENELRQLIAEHEEMKHDTAFGILTKPGLTIESRKQIDAVAIVFIDIDKVHALNDKYGYDKVNDMVKSAMKIRQDDILLTGRWFSGDEIVLIVKGDPAGVSKRLMESLNKHGLSATIAYTPLNNELEKAVKRASDRVELAKHNDNRGVIIEVA